MLLLTSEVKAPDPFVGFGITPIPISFESATEGEEPGKSRRKYFQIGAPFELREISIGEIDSLKLLFVPEVTFNSGVYLAQGSLVIEELLPFRAYRSVPSGIVWGAGVGGHLGWIKKKDSYIVDGEPMTAPDQLSLGGVVKLYAGPAFTLSQSFSLRLRFGFDIPFGRLAPYTVAVGSRGWGLVHVMQAQLVIQ